MEGTPVNLRIRGECGGSIDCSVTGKEDGSVWYEVVVRVPGHPVLRVDLTKALHVENLSHAVAQFIDSRPDSGRILFPVAIESGSVSGADERIVRATSMGELEQAIRRALEPLPWS